MQPVHVLSSPSTVAGNDLELKYVAEVFQNKYKTKVRRILGSDLHDMKAMTILNRIVEWTNAGIQYEADPRHVNLIIEELGLENASIAARLNFLAADTVDVQFASKERCKRMSSPCMSDWAKVRKLVRYLRKHPRQVLWFAWQDVQSNLQVYVDTDYPGWSCTGATC